MEEEMNEMESKHTTVHTYIRKYTVSYSNYPSKFYYNFLINENIGIEDTTYIDVIQWQTNWAVAWTSSCADGLTDTSTNLP